MNTITQLQIKLMSSKEIANLTEKRHADVIRDIRQILDKLDDAILRHEEYQELKDNRGYTSEFLLNKNLSITLMTGYDVNARHKINVRWQELEAQVAQPVIPQTYSEALQLAADKARQLELAAPKINHYDTVVEKSALLNATQVAQKVGWSAIQLNKALDELNVYNKAILRGRAFKQWFIGQHLGIMRQTDSGYAQPMFTMKGEAWIVEKLISEGLVDSTALAKHFGRETT